LPRLPGLNGFVGEFAILVGAFQANPWWAVFATLGVIFAAWYLLTAVRGMVHGPLDEEKNGDLTDLTKREILLLAPLVRPWRWSQASWLHLIASPFVKELPRKYRPNSTDEAFTAFLRDQDPLQPERLSVAWITAMRRWMPRLLALEPNPLPTLILQGEQDLTVDWEWNLAILAEKFPNAEIHRPPAARHRLMRPAMTRAT